MRKKPPHRVPRLSRRQLRRRLALCAAAACVAVAAGAVALDRYLWRRGEAAKVYDTGPGAAPRRGLYEWNDNLANSLLFRVDPELSWGLRPGARLKLAYLWGHGKRKRFDVTVNDLGCRGKPLSKQKDPKGLRLFCLGDSRTYGQGVNDNATYPAQLERQLAHVLPDRRVECLNAGAPGYSSFQGMLLANRLLAYGPDAFVLCFSTNDATPRPRSDSEVHAHTSRVLTTVQAWLDRSMIYLRFRQALRRSHKPTPRVGEAGPRVAPSEYVQNLTQVLELCRIAGVQPVLVHIPALCDKGVVDAPYAEVTRAFARRKDVVLVDFRAVMAADRRDPAGFYIEAGYLNEAGHRLLAGALAEAIAGSREGDPKP